ncbi:pimeloyl-ACP methyl ester carboxylesterase [Nocardia tenerifensis]|uniref:prolyl aminopeptidase n=1 Tax=Nocardia tenerifensis TaxID=228006 RepID=A0A318K476_9NOCA|nr:alpha/beta hydrolase [Nocardia tenerifensis]PXX66894.1 pimeloyl-ACP methyl ester carboxylesterase [Nocardia tenerifensis]
MIALALATAVSAAPAALFGHRQLRRRKAAAELRIDTPNGIDESGFVRIGGIEQWIEIRGEDTANPVLLDLHGGPGATNTYFAHRTRAWERHFTVVRWDMRGAGKTFGRGEQGTVCFDQLLADAVEVTGYVRERLRTNEVILLGNSFGSVFGLRLAREHPELYSAYVGTDQNVCGGEPDDIAFHETVRRLRSSGKGSAAAKLERMGADPTTWTAADWGLNAKLTASADPFVATMFKKLILPAMWFSPRHRLRDLKAGADGMKFSERVGVESVHFDAWRDGTRFDLPFFIFQGEHDSLTPAPRARRYFDDVQAPHKEFALITDATHFASFWQPEQFLELLLTKVRPVVVAARKG